MRASRHAQALREAPAARRRRGSEQLGEQREAARARASRNGTRPGGNNDKSWTSLPARARRGHGARNVATSDEDNYFDMDRSDEDEEDAIAADHDNEDELDHGTGDLEDEDFGLGGVGLDDAEGYFTSLIEAAEADSGTSLGMLSRRSGRSAGQRRRKRADAPRHAAVAAAAVARPEAASHLVEEVAMRLKQAEVRVLDAERQSRALEVEAARLRASIAELQQTRARELEARADQEAKTQAKLDQALEELDARQKELHEVREASAAAQKRVQDLDLERSERERRLAKERDQFEEDVRAERARFVKLKTETEELEIAAQREQRAAAQKLEDARAALEAEADRAREANAALRKATLEREKIQQTLDTLREQKRDLGDVAAAARRAEQETKAAVQEAETRVALAERAQHDADERRKYLETQLAQCTRTLEDARTEREQTLRQLERVRAENGELVRELERLGESKASHAQQTESLRRQVEEAKEEARRHAQRLRASETKAREDRQLAVAKAEHDNQMLRLELERAQADLQQAQAANVATQSSARAARIEVERISQALQRGKAASSSLAQELHEKQRIQAQLLALQREVEALRSSKEAVVQRSHQLKRDLDRKADEAHRLAHLADDLQTQLRLADQDKDDLARRHRQTVQAKEAENSYVWRKLEQALRM